MADLILGQPSKVACCLCGSLMVYNAAGICTECLKSQVDITDGLDTTNILVQCGKCDRWHIEGDRWHHHEIESASLLALCLKKLRLTTEHKIKNAAFIWTEPHCKRIKVSVDLEKEVLDGKVTLGSNLVVEFKVVAKQCMECIREATDHSWGALIQVRQRVGHKRSFFQLERLLIDANLHQLMMGVEIAREGLDMYFKSKNQSDRVIDLVMSSMPSQKKDSRKLVSQDKKSNTSKYELTTLLEVAPLCKGDLVIIPKAITGMCELMLITKLQSSIHVLNPVTLSRAEIKPSKYFATPFSALLSIQHLVTFIVLDITVIDDKQSGFSAAGGGSVSGPHPVTGGRLAEAEVARESDLGDNDQTYRLVTHLGHVLQAGDTCLGYFLLHATHVDEEMASAGVSLATAMPEIVLVRKTYPDKQKKNKQPRKKEGGRWVPLARGGDGERAAAEDEAFERQQDDEAALAEELNLPLDEMVGFAHGGLVRGESKVAGEGGGEEAEAAFGEATVEEEG